MPWRIVRSKKLCSEAKPWAVVKVSDGSKVGCHPSKERAQKQLAALHANVRD